MTKIGFVVIAASCLLLEMNQVLSNGNNSNAQFSSLLKPVVGDSQLFKINGPNGFCAETSNWVLLILHTCIASDERSRLFSLSDDGTIRINYNGKCLTARGSTRGSKVEPDSCANSNRNAITWQVTLSDRQILHPSSGLVLSAIPGTFSAVFTLEQNVFSSFQTFRLDRNPPTPTAHIIGMNGLCLLTSSNDDVWLGSCGSSGSWQKWLIYADGTVRPQQSPNGCLSYENLTSRRVLVTSCGLAPTAERWLFTANSAIYNENANLVMDVAAANPSLRTILVYSPSGGVNQQFRIFYD